MAKYAQFHLGESSAKLISEKSRKLLHKSISNNHYALGWMVKSDEKTFGTIITHVGTNTMFYSIIWISPERNFAAVAACNAGNGSTVCNKAIQHLIRKYLD